MSYKYATLEDTLADVLPAVPADDNDDQTETVTRLIESASALIDRYTKRPAGYFVTVAAETEPTVRRYRGTGANFLQVGRYVAGDPGLTIENVGSELFYLNHENGWPFAVDAAGNAGYGGEYYRGPVCQLFAAGALYAVTAVWGFAATPDDIATATKLIVQHIWDRGHGTFGQISPTGFVIERDIPPTARLILDGWVRREFEVN